MRREASVFDELRAAGIGEDLIEVPNEFFEEFEAVSRVPSKRPPAHFIRA